jgi:hypothetical protein
MRRGLIFIGLATNSWNNWGKSWHKPIKKNTTCSKKGGTLFGWGWEAENVGEDGLKVCQLELSL